MNGRQSDCRTVACIFATVEGEKQDEQFTQKGTYSSECLPERGGNSFPVLVTAWIRKNMDTARDIGLCFAVYAVPSHLRT